MFGAGPQVLNLIADQFCVVHAFINWFILFDLLDDSLVGKQSVETSIEIAPLVLGSSSGNTEPSGHYSQLPHQRTILTAP
jgi:hypothetical protein